MDKKAKISGTFLIFIVLIAGALIGFLWNNILIIKQSVHLVLDPTLGRLLDQNINVGMILITALITLIITFVQKYTMDHKRIKELKDEQKDLQKKMQEHKEHPEKLTEINKELMAKFLELMHLSMSSAIYTLIPIILFFRWFQDYFVTNPLKIFGVLSWFWAYLIFSIIFASVFRKLFKLP